MENIQSCFNLLSSSLLSNFSMEGELLISVDGSVSENRELGSEKSSRFFSHSSHASSPFLKKYLPRSHDSLKQLL